MATYRVTNAITLDVLYTGNAIVDSVSANRVLRPRWHSGVLYLGVYDTTLSDWTGEFFTSGDTLHLPSHKLTLGMSILPYDGQSANITHAAGGYISLQQGNWTIVANLTAGPAAILDIGANSNGYTITIKGNINGGTVMGAQGCFVNNTTAAVIVEGNLNGANSMACHCNFLSGGSITIHGNVTGGTGYQAYGLNLTGGEGVINGNVIGGNSFLPHGCTVAGSATRLTINGDAIGGTSIYTGGLYIGAAIPVVVNGNIRCSVNAPRSIGVAGRVDTLTWTGYFQIYSGGVSYNLYKNGNGGAAGHSGLYRSLR